MKLKDYAVYTYNPFRIDGDFMRNFPKEVNKVVSADGEYMGSNKEWVSWDKQPHIKVYNDMYDIFTKLNTSGIMILSYIFKELKDDQDEVFLNVQLIMAVNELKSRTAVYTGIMDLMNNQIIAKKVGGDTYYINPAYIYKGKRIDWYRKYTDYDKHNNVPTIKAFKMKNKTYETK
jgi:hypothetical protein